MITSHVIFVTRRSNDRRYLALTPYFCRLDFAWLLGMSESALSAAQESERGSEPAVQRNGLFVASGGAAGDDSAAAMALFNLDGVQGNVTLPAIPLLATYGYSYIPCAPLAVVAWMGPDTAEHMRGRLPDELVFPAEVSAWPLHVYYVIHCAPVLQPCQKFLCDNMNEVNLMLHLWTNEGKLFDEELVANDSVPCGVWPVRDGKAMMGIQPIHQDLKDAGVRFGRFEERSVVIHDMCFSPENAMVQLCERMDTSQAHSFLSAAYFNGRRVVVHHVLAHDDVAERCLTACKDGATCAFDLAQRLAAARLFAKEAADLCALLGRRLQMRD